MYDASDKTALEIEKEVEELIARRGGKSLAYKGPLSNPPVTRKVV